MGKKSFILHHDFSETLDKLSDEQAGQLLKAVYSWQLTGELPAVDMTIDLVVTPLITQFKRDNEQYARICKRNEDNGKQGGRPRKKPKKPTRLSGNPEEPKKPDSDSGSERDNDSGNLKRFIIPNVCIVRNYMAERGKIKEPEEEAERFIDHYTNKDWRIGTARTKMKSWQAAVRNWEKNYKDRRGTDSTSPVPQWVKLLKSLHGKALEADESTEWIKEIRNSRKEKMGERTEEEIGNYLCRVIRAVGSYEVLPRADANRMMAPINLSDIQIWITSYERYR